MTAAIPSRSILFLHKVTLVTAPASVFSVERAMLHLPVIALEPHPSVSAAQAAVRDYLVQQLTVLGFQPEIQKSSSIENVVARLPSGTCRHTCLLGFLSCLLFV